MSRWRIARLIAAKELRIERHSKVITNQVLPFAAVTMVMFAFALDSRGVDTTGTGETRTVRARIEVDNPGHALRPGQYANVEIEKDLGEVVLVPDSAVIDTGVRKIVFVRTDAERFEPREVQLGARAEARFAALAGLREGDQVVTSANFLIDAESRLRAAIEKQGTAPAGHSGHGAK